MRKFYSVFIFSLLALPLAAQDMYRFGSSYSFAGVGELVDFRSSYAEPMGVTGIAAFNTTSPGTANPAFLGGIALTSSGSNAVFRSLAITAPGSATLNTQLQVNSFQLMLPLVKNKIGFSLSLLPLTERSYKTEKLNLRSVNDPSVQFDLTELGEGNLNRLEAGFGMAITPQLYLGYSAGIIFGSLSRQSTLEFYSSSLSPSQQTYTNAHLGMSNRFGLAYRLGKTKEGGYRMIAGMVAELPVKLTVDRTLTDYYLASQTSGGGYASVSVDLAGATVDVPASFGGGVSYFLNPQVMLTTEALVQNWSSFEYPDNTQGIEYHNRFRLGGGGQYSPSTRLSRAKWRRFKYRAGLVLDSGNNSVLGERISTFSVTGGISIPSPTSGSTIDINGSFGRRGSTSAGLVNENIFTLRVALNLSEFMFFKRYIQ